MKAFCLFLTVQLAILNIQFAAAQDIYVARGGHASFFSEAPIENIDAHNDSVTSGINPATSQIVFVIPMREFQFRKKLMQEHFNDKYLHTDKFPKANFKGKILDEVDYKKEGTYNVTVEGDLTIHGVTKHRKEKATLIIKDGKITGTSQFTVRVADHNIDIPTLLIKNIAEEVLVKINVTYLPKAK